MAVAFIARNMLSLLLFAGGLASANPGPWHYPRQANSSITSSAAVTGTAVHNCSWSWDQWLWSSIDVQYTNFTNITSTYTYYNVTASLTTACDNVTRIVGDLTTIATGTNTTFTSTSHNYTVPTPTCTPEPVDCSSLNALHGTYPCPRPTTQVTNSCGQCSIWGGTVDLIYFPITATTSHNLCADPTVSPGSPTICPLGPTTATRNATNPYDYQPCYYATGNTTSTSNSGPYVVSDGHTFYQNRAYISMQTAYASDRCGIIGQKHEGTILEVKSEDVYSVGGYHHEFQDAGYQFNFQDLQAVPSYAYYLDCNAGGPASCYYEGTRYRYGTDFLNGYTDIDFGESGVVSTDKQWIFQEAYTPILLLPTQIRDLDPAWSSCSLNLGGLYDPPKALTQVATQPGPTAPTPDPGDGGTTAAPGNGPTTSGPTPTALPITEPTTPAGDGQPTGTPDDPTVGGDDDTPAPTTPNDPDQPEPTGADPGEDADPTTANTPTPTDGADGDDDGEDGDDDDSDANLPAPTTPDIGGIVISAIVPTTTTQNVGEIVASIIGITSANDQNDQDSPAPTPESNDNSADDQNDQDSPAPTPDSDGNNNSQDNESDASEPDPAPVTFTADDGSTQTVSVVEGTSDLFVVGDQTVTAGGSAVEVDGQTVSAGSSGQIVVGSQTIIADSTPSLSAGVSAQDTAPTGSDGSVISISTVTAGSSGVYVAGGTSLSVGGEDQVVNGATLSAAPTGVVNVSDDSSSGPSETDSSSEGSSATGSGSPPQQFGNAAPNIVKANWLTSAAACALAAVLALR